MGKRRGRQRRGKGKRASSQGARSTGVSQRAPDPVQPDQDGRQAPSEAEIQQALLAAPDPVRVVVPTGPSLEEAYRRVGVLSLRTAEMHALLEPTARQGPEGDSRRLEFVRWSLELGTAFCDSDRPEKGIPFLHSAATIAEIVIGHQPDNADALRLGTAAVASLAHELMLQQRSSEAWEWAARTVRAAERLAQLDPTSPEGPLQVCRLNAVLASLSPARRPSPPAHMRDESVPGQQLVAVDAFYALLSEAVDAATLALRRAPDHLESRLQLGQEAWNLGLYLETRPGLPGGDLSYYAGLVVEALAPVQEQGLHADLCTPALRWARAFTTS